MGKEWQEKSNLDMMREKLKLVSDWGSNAPSHPHPSSLIHNQEESQTQTACPPKVFLSPQPPLPSTHSKTAVWFIKCPVETAPPPRSKKKKRRQSEKLLVSIQGIC